MALYQRERAKGEGPVRLVTETRAEIRQLAREQRGFVEREGMDGECEDRSMTVAASMRRPTVSTRFFLDLSTMAVADQREAPHGSPVFFSAIVDHLHLC